VFDLYINTAHFKEAGLDPDRDAPKTWDQTLEVAKKLTKTEGGKITRQGFRFPIVNRPNVQTSFEQILFQFGGSAVGPDGKCALNNEAGVKAMDLYASFTRQKVMDPNVSVATVPIPTLDIARDVTSMETGHPLTVQFIRDNNRAMFDSKGFKVAPLPQVDPNKRITVMNGQTFAVNAAASPEKIAVAQDFLRTLIARPNEWLSRVGAIAPLNALLETPEAKSFPYLDVILDDMKYGKHATLSKFAAEISEGEFRAVQAVLLSNVDSKRALDDACGEINRAIGY
jgi:multiple sugar transport system substrate-binding protein